MSASSSTRLGAAIGLLACLGLAALSMALSGPPSVVPSSAPAEAASAERAARHVAAIASEPHPPGTVAHQRALDYLIAELEALGLAPEVQEGWVVNSRGSRAFGARVRNVLARLEGEVEGPALLLLSHYDSVPSAPGAADAAAGVAAILETVRALREGPSLRNDLIVLITDGEESGLLGARLFVEEHPWAAEVGLVLNFEARGNRGPVTLFETSDGNGALARAVASHAPHPMGSSMSYEVYRRMPNDTDLTVFLNAGVPGLNFAMIGNHPAYHTELDTPELLDARSLQHHAGYALSLTRHFGDTDLGALRASNAVYFNPLGAWMVVYSSGLGKGLAFALLALLLAVIVWGLSSGRLNGAGIRGGLWASLFLLVVAPLVMAAAWSFFTQFFPEALASPYGEPYAAGLVRLAALLLCLAVAALAREIFEAPTAREMLTGALLVWSVLGWLVSMFVPGAGYLLIWPALLGLLGLAAAMSVGSGLLGALSISLGAATASMLFGPTVVLVSEALQVNAAAVLALVIALPLTLLLPLLRVALGGQLVVAGVLAAAGLGTLAWVGAVAEPSDRTPRPTSLFYLLDTEASEAHWLSYEEAPDAWTGRVLAADAIPGDPPEAFANATRSQLLSAPARTVDLEPPSATMVADEFEDGVRRLTIRVRSPRGAPSMMLAPDPTLATIQAIGVDGEVVPIDESQGPVLITLQGLPSEGVLVSFEILDRQPVALDLLDWSWGLPELAAEELGERPPELLRRPRWLTDSLLVRTTQWF